MALEKLFLLDFSDTLALALTAGEVVLVNAVSRQIFRRFPNLVTHPCTDLVSLLISIFQ